MSPLLQWTPKKPDPRELSLAVRQTTIEQRRREAEALLTKLLAKLGGQDA